MNKRRVGVLLGVLLAWAAWLPAAMAAPKAEVRPALRVLVHGDSLSAGYGLELGQEWPALLQRQLQKSPFSGVQVANSSISGETTAGGLARLLVALCDDGVVGDARLLLPDTARLMRTPQNGLGSVSCQSGRGLFVNILTDDQVEGRTLYGHGGKAYGMLCAAYFDPTDRTGVVMLTNGCSLKSVHNGVGMLGRLVCTLCYREFLEPTHRAENPYLIPAE